MIKHAERILEVLIDLAPDEHAKIGLMGVATEVLSNETPHDSLRIITGWLYDGVAYGNWPWTLPHMLD